MSHTKLSDGKQIPQLVTSAIEWGVVACLVRKECQEWLAVSAMGA